MLGLDSYRDSTLHDQFPEEEGLKRFSDPPLAATFVKLHDQFPEEEGLKPNLLVDSDSLNILHDQFPEEEGLKHVTTGVRLSLNRLHDQFPEEEGLKQAVDQITKPMRVIFMTSFQRKKD